MRLLFFTDTYLPQINGVSRTLGRLSDYLHRTGTEHLIVTPRSGGDGRPAAPHDPQGGLPVRSLASIPFALYPQCRLALPMMASLRQEIEAFEPDLIHLLTPFNVGLSGLRFARRQGIPHVASYHTHFDRYMEHYHMKALIPAYWAYTRWFHQSCSAIFAPSAETVDVLREQGLHRLRIWSRGVDAALYSPAKRNAGLRERLGIAAPLLLLYVGRIAPEKDIDTLTAIMHTIPEPLRSQVHWLVAGDGPRLPELQAEAPAGVTFLGHTEGEELAELYASADLFVFPSSTETFGNVVLESLASGLPVIGAAAGGVQELVTDGRTGRLCEPGQPADFVQAITELLSSPGELARYREAARQAALRRSWDSIFAGLIDDYAGVLETQRAAAAFPA
ncbi:glycosyltransferase family 4 protein [Paenibacillus sp. 1P07SE]|uniref:glycosyltransferase family 4 protein n=1 Tax=Paenibacillus sp. 1P07SE TaxID=3132209 RepID=UPI0039A504A9